MPIFGGAPAGSGLNYLASSGLLNTGTNPLAGLGSMIDVTNSRIYLPAQSASGNTFNLFAEFEV